jgi:hypothetical protein
MKKIVLILTVSALLFNCSGCQEKKRKESVNLTGKPDLKLSCVAGYLRSDGSRYITEQKYKIFASPRAIILSANEPFGEIIWSVQNGVYIVQKGGPENFFDKKLYGLIMDADIANGLLELYLQGMAGGKSAIGNAGKTLTFEGQLYELVTQNWGVNLYRNKSTGKVNLAVSGTYLLYGFNYQKNGPKGIYPSKLDIYLYHTDLDKKLAAQINCSLD